MEHVPRKIPVLPWDCDTFRVIEELKVSIELKFASSLHFA